MKLVPLAAALATLILTPALLAAAEPEITAPTPRALTPA